MKKRDYEITVKRVSVVGFNVEATSIQNAKEQAEKDAKNHNWASEDAEYIIGDDDAPEILKKIDWSELRNQKSTLLAIISGVNVKQENIGDLDGILNLIDALQDYAVDVLGISAVHVFNFEEEENREKETPKERFARESAENIFDELRESDGFHQDDEMSSIFIEEIMANEMHASIIKAKIKNQILEDLKNNPLEFKYDVTMPTGIPMYDSDMREDYEGMATAYIRELFNEGKVKKLWLCPHCGSDNVETKAWVNANTNELSTYDNGEDEGYCNDCESHGELILSDVKYNAEIVGFQVVDDVKGEMHPDMTGSFCLYNLTQAREMIRNSDDPTDCWKLLAIWTGDVEEPTIMFEGDPRE